VSADGIAYPPEPWQLRGVFRASLWLVPRSSVEGFLPQGVSPVTLDDKVLILTGWAVYTPGGVLEYRELLCAVAVGSWRTLGVTVTHIWVDNPASMAGGRELWGIPKRLARFTSPESDGFSEEAHDEHGPIARLAFGRTASLPGRWPLPLRTIQSLEGKLKVTRVRATGQVGFGSARWSFDEAGPLAFLHGLRPIVSMRLGSMGVSFGL
jgi:hypothetical protein